MHTSAFLFDYNIYLESKTIILKSEAAKLQEGIRNKRNTTNIMQGGPQWYETYTICSYNSSYSQ